MQAKRTSDRKTKDKSRADAGQEGDTAGARQDRRVAGQKGGGKRGIQDRRKAIHKTGMTGGRQMTGEMERTGGM